MNDRLIAFLQAEELSSARFADIMQIQRSSVSHLLSGRNKPGCDFFEKFIQKFPAVNIEWLISGRGKMYKEQAQAVPPPVINHRPKIDEMDLFSAQVPTINPQPGVTAGTGCFVGQRPPRNDGVTAETISSSSPKTERHINRVIILYSDGTFEERD